MSDAKIDKSEIPTSDFIEDVDAFCAGKDVDEVLKQLNDRLRGLRLIEGELQKRKQHLLSKMPEIEKAYAMVSKLLEADGEAMSLDFELSPHVYTVAKLENVKTVNLWLGANVMVEYELSEANALLESNLKICKANLASANSDLDMIKESSTTTEVSLARVFNYDVERRRKIKEADAEMAKAVEGVSVSVD